MELIVINEINVILTETENNDIEFEKKAIIECLNINGVPKKSNFKVGRLKFSLTIKDNRVYLTIKNDKE